MALALQDDGPFVYMCEFVCQIIPWTIFFFETYNDSYDIVKALDAAGAKGTFFVSE